MSWRRPLPPPRSDHSLDGLAIVTLAPEHFAALEELQRAVFPTVGSHILMRAEQYAAQYRIFREGQFVALLNGKVVGQGSGFFIDFDFAHPQHTFLAICANTYYTNHDPDGAYYYGADISVHPAYQGRGIGRRLYAARMDLVRRANRRGIVGGGLIPGYAAYKGRLSVAEYVDRVVAGELRDPTLSFQLRIGFVVRGLIEDYIEDSASDNWSTLIEWPNPDYTPPTRPAR